MLQKLLYLIASLSKRTSNIYSHRHMITQADNSCKCFVDFLHTTVISHYRTAIRIPIGKVLAEGKNTLIEHLSFL